MPVKEVMLNMDWSPELSILLGDARLGMGVHSKADVIRDALRVVPTLVFNHIKIDDLTCEVGKKPCSLLDYVEPTDYSRKAAVRVPEIDLRRSELAAEACALTLGDFAYRSAFLFVQNELLMPGHEARVKADEDMRSRIVLGLTDIQPWGEEDNRDYGLPD